MSRVSVARQIPDFTGVSENAGKLVEMIKDESIPNNNRSLICNLLVLKDISGVKINSPRGRDSYA